LHLYLVEKKKILNNQKFNRKAIVTLLEKIFISFYFESLPSFDEEKTEKIDAVWNLFIWCILTNRNKMAKLFWRIGKVFYDFNIILIINYKLKFLQELVNFNY
jgi:hypothetical protein